MQKYLKKSKKIICIISESELELSHQRSNGDKNIMKQDSNTKAKNQNPFKFVPESLDFAKGLVDKSHGDFPSVIFSLCYAGASMAFMEKRNNLDHAFHLLLSAYVLACEDIINDSALVDKKEQKQVTKNGQTIH